MSSCAGRLAHRAVWFRKFHIRWLSIIMMTIITESLAHPQVGPPVFDPTGRSGEPPAPLRKEFERPIPPPRPVLPPAPLLPEEPRDQRLGQIRVFVEDIHVVGSTVFSD